MSVCCCHVVVVVFVLFFCFFCLFVFLSTCSYSILSKFQSRFRPNNSTVLALIQMCDDWLENIDNGKLNSVVFLDTKKAFDSINHSILLKILNEHFGITGTELKWFESYLSKGNSNALLMANYHHRK